MSTQARYRSRTFQRHRFDLRVKLVVNNRFGRHTVIHGRTRDLSFSGMGVVVTQALDHGAVCVLVLKFPKTDVEVQLPAVVTHGKGFHYGVQFQSLTGEQKLLIQKICKALPA